MKLEQSLYSVFKAACPVFFSDSLSVCLILPAQCRWGEASSAKSPRQTCLAQSQTRASLRPDAHTVEKMGVILGLEMWGETEKANLSKKKKK